MKRLLILSLAFFSVFLPVVVMAGEERPEVDDIARLLAMRLALAREVAWSKSNAGIPVADPAREAALLTSLKAEGRDYSLTPGRVTALFLPQIAASRRYQEELLMQWRAGFPRPKTPPLDLRTAIRPRIDALDTELLRRWAAFPRDQLDGWSREETERLLRERGIPDAVARIAARPLGSP